MMGIGLSPALLGPRGWSPDVLDLLPVRESLNRARSCNLLLAASTPEHGGGGSGGSRVYGPPGMCVRVRVTDLSSHLQNGCHRPSDEGRGVKHASVMVTEGIGTTCNHSWLTLGVVDFPLGPPRGRSGPSRRPSGLSSQLKIRRQDELQLYRSVPSCLE